MLHKKQERTTEDAPDSIEPWEMLDEAAMATITARVQSRYPDMNLTAFARRIDSNLRACFDKGPDGRSKRVAVVAESGGEVVKHYSGFSEWFDDALADARRMDN